MLSKWKAKAVCCRLRSAPRAGLGTGEQVSRGTRQTRAKRGGKVRKKKKEIRRKRKEGHTRPTQPNKSLPPRKETRIAGEELDGKLRWEAKQYERKRQKKVEDRQRERRKEERLEKMFRTWFCGVLGGFLLESGWEGLDKVGGVGEGVSGQDWLDMHKLTEEVCE